MAATFGPVLAGYVAAVAVVAVLVVTAGAAWSPAGVLRAAVFCWLAMHQVPLTVSSAGGGGTGAVLGVLPLLPTIGMVILVARATARAAIRLGWLAPVRLALLAGLAGGVHGGAGVLVAVLGPASRLTAAGSAAFTGCAVIAGGAALAGGLRAASPSMVLSGLLPAWVVRGLRAGLFGLTALLAAGGLAVLAGLLLSAGTVHDGVAAWGHAAAGPAGITALSIAYLPNAAVGALSWAAGAGLSVGAVTVNPFAATAAPLPAVPLLAALAGPGVAALRPLAIAAPLLVGVLVGARCRAVGGTATDRLSGAVAAATASAGCLVLAVLAGGHLGRGAFDPVRVPPVSLAAALLLWLAVPACGLAVLPGRCCGRRRGA